MNAPARRVHPLHADRRRGAAGRGRTTRRATRSTITRGPESGPLVARVVQDRRGPVRRPADLPARPLRHAPQPGPRLERQPRARTSGSASCCSSTARSRSRSASSRPGEIGAVAKLTVTETGDTLVVAARSRSSCRRSTSRRRRSSVAIEPQTKADLDKMGAALQRMLEEEPTGAGRAHRRPASRSCATMGEAHIAVIGERLKRKFGAAIVDPHAQGPLQRDDPRQDQGRRPVQEADRRPRDVRRRLAGDRAEPGRRRRVRRAGRRRLGAQGLLPGRREGHPRGGGRGRRRRLSAVGLPGDALRRLVPPRRLERALVQDRGLDGAQGRRPPGASRRSSSRSWRSRSASPRRTWARSTATSTAVAAGSSAWTPTAASRSSRRTCPQAELFTYATELRSLTHGRGTFTLDARPLRGRALAHRREGDRDASQGARGERRPRRPLTSRPSTRGRTSPTARPRSWPPPTLH